MVRHQSSLPEPPSVNARNAVTSESEPPSRLRQLLESLRSRLDPHVRSRSQQLGQSRRAQAGQVVGKGTGTYTGILPTAPLSPSSTPVGFDKIEN